MESGKDNKLVKKCKETLFYQLKSCGFEPEFEIFKFDDEFLSNKSTSRLYFEKNKSVTLNDVAVQKLFGVIEIMSGVCEKDLNFNITDNCMIYKLTEKTVKNLKKDMLKHIINNEFTGYKAYAKSDVFFHYIYNYLGKIADNYNYSEKQFSNLIDLSIEVLKQQNDTFDLQIANSIRNEQDKIRKNIKEDKYIALKSAK